MTSDQSIKTFRFVWRPFSLIPFLEFAVRHIAAPARSVLSSVTSYYGNGGGKFPDKVPSSITSLAIFEYKVAAPEQLYGSLKSPACSCVSVLASFIVNALLGPIAPKFAMHTLNLYTASETWVEEIYAAGLLRPGALVSAT